MTALAAHAPAAPLWVTVALLVVVLGGGLAAADLWRRAWWRRLARSVPHRPDGVVVEWTGRRRR